MDNGLSAVQVAVERALSVLRHRPSALITDIDGTISQIVLRPEDATVSEEIRGSLARVAARLSLVGIVTARQMSVARTMVGIDTLTYVGNYAVQTAEAGSTVTDETEPLYAMVLPLLAEMPCVELEEKGISFALHYRNCSEPDMRERLMSLVEPVAIAAGSKVVEGKQVLEVVPAALPDKGVALARLLDSAEIRGAIFMGDDLSDAAAFRELVRRRTDDKPSLAIAVVDDETPEAVRAAGDLELPGVAGVTQFLNRLAGELERGGG